MASYNTRTTGVPLNGGVTIDVIWEANMKAYHDHGHAGEEYNINRAGGLPPHRRSFQLKGLETEVNDVLLLMVVKKGNASSGIDIVAQSQNTDKREKSEDLGRNIKAQYPVIDAYRTSLD
ncbi:hypothetical protein PAXINDRAFT_15413 [Paxillus involutus ATCC 200175]|uniref:Uncharacterized protein n=1 Tax=Paxillus involutus ATCC 200175 TaxID=664439 RepID=A0A0C9T7S9_PAXIN|nr:hypothetical protein PAXINDRAFT_15413 [Paxillus involutus ATCC 200175]